MQTLNLGEWLADLIRQHQEAARWAGVELRLRPCNYWVRTDPALLATMVQNVLSNCFKYGAQRPVLIGVRKRGAGLAIVIHDRGNGIAEEHLHKVFEEFYRVRQVRDKDVEGVGLGLSIIKRLGELIDVHVALRSQLGRGTAVTLAGLPIVAAPQSPVVRSEARQVGLLTGLKVCLVEDDRNVLLATSALLERWGCVVQGEWSAEDLVTDCDIIVADYDLGTHATGIECIDEVRRRRGWAVPAMIITGHDVEKIQAALHDRQIAILSKPVRPAELRATLRALRDRQGAAVEQML
jgi:CheY-like chemotaxis protein/anti-sigma regulatory factor (Ser/Thr protein kinase)